ncbi:MAG: hypothetical protein RLY86_1698 [Pseudomonadota bacterium]|jgi:hypothetical protein
MVDVGVKRPAARFAQPQPRIRAGRAEPQFEVPVTAVPVIDPTGVSSHFLRIAS